MKKIVGIIAAVAMAASVFGAEVSGAIRLSGDLFNYNGEKKEADALKLKNENMFWHSPVTFSVSTDNVGATWKWTDESGDTMKTGKWAIWFKPAEAIKVNLGTIDKSMNNDSIDWTNRLINYDNWGIAVDFAANGFSARLSLVNNKDSFFFLNGDEGKKANESAVDSRLKIKENAKKEYWKALGKEESEGTQAEKEAAENAAKTAYEAYITLHEQSKTYIGEVNLYAEYAADFGTISAMYDAKDSFTINSIGAGYKGSFGDVTLFADGAVYLVKDVKTTFGGDFDIKYNANGLGIESYTQYKTAAEGDGSLMEIFKISYAFDTITPYLYFKDANFMAKDFACTIKPGFTASFGAMSYEMAVQIDIAKKVNVSVPVNFSVKF